jgi:Na+-driven multidrug efflux pump
MATSVNVLLSFVASGLEKGVMAITANCLGAGDTKNIKQLLKNSIILHLSFVFILFFVFFMTPEIIINRFMRFDIPPDILEKSIFVLRLVWTFFVFDGICWIIAGIVESGGDLRYMMWSFALSSWLVVVVPCLVIHNFGTISVEAIWILLIVSVIASVVVLFLRYKTNNWIKIRVSHEK